MSERFSEAHLLGKKVQLVQARTAFLRRDVTLAGDGMEVSELLMVELEEYRLLSGNHDSV